MIKQGSAVALLLLLLISCKKEDESLIPDQYWGEAFALKNKTEWNPYIIGIKIDSTDRFTLFFDGYDDLGYRGERIAIKLPQDSLGHFNIYNVQNRDSDSVRAAYRELLGGDVIGNSYNIDNLSLSYIEITSYNQGTKEISGTFEMTFVLETDFGYNPNRPDTIRFTEGKFHTEVRDDWK